MFKKSLLALSVLAVASTASAAGSYITVSPAGDTPSTAVPTASVQGYALKASTAKHFSPNHVVYTVSSASNDLVNVNGGSVTLSGITFLNSGVTLTMSSASSDSIHAAGTTISPKFVFGETSKLTFDISGGVSNGDYLTISSASFVPTSASKGDMPSVTVALNTALNTIDSATGAIAKFVDQFSIAATDTLGDTKIDVAQNAEALTASSEAFGLAVTSTLTDYYHHSSGVSVSAPLVGDFSWALNASQAGISGSVLTASDGFVFNSGAQKLSTIMTPSSTATASQAYTVNFAPVKGKNGALTASTYTSDVKVTSGTTTLASESLKFGSLELNGSSVTIPFMPFGAAYAQSITVSNSSTLSGDIKVSLTANGKTTDLATVGTASAKSITNIGKAVRDLALANGIYDAQVNVVVQAPDASVKVSAVYYSKADQDRVLVPVEK